MNVLVLNFNICRLMRASLRDKHFSWKHCAIFWISLQSRILVELREICFRIGIIFAFYLLACLANVLGIHWSIFFSWNLKIFLSISFFDETACTFYSIFWMFQKEFYFCWFSKLNKICCLSKSIRKFMI